MQIINAIEIKYINDTHKIVATKKAIFLPIVYTKSLIRESEIGSIIAEDNLIPKLNIAILTIGIIMLAKSKNNPATPTAFFMRIELDIIQIEAVRQISPNNRHVTFNCIFGSFN